MSLVTCLHPKEVVNPHNGERYVVPCRKCAACLKKRSEEWKTKLNLELQNWKYGIFFTLTYNDKYLPRIDVTAFEIDDPDYDEEFINAVLDSSKLVDVYEGKVPCFSTRNIQLFIKRLRQKVYEHETSKECAYLRFYIGSEYGPTTYRPHHHGILFTNSEYLALNHSQLISDSWSHRIEGTYNYESLGYITSEHVNGDSPQYCSQYVTFVSNLPRLLQHKLFRPRAYYSTAPALGSCQVKDDQIQKIFHEGLTQFSYQSPSTNEIVTVPLWRNIKNRLFPKCLRYGELDTLERTKLYGLSQDPELGFDCSCALARLYTLWFKNELHESTSYILRNFKIASPDNIRRLDETAFRRAWLLSNHVLTMCNYFNVTLDYYVSRIELFYQNADKDGLTSQLNDEVDYCNHVPKYPLDKLPFLIDPLFYNNSRELRPWVYKKYLEQFNVDDIEIPDLKVTETYRHVEQSATDFLTKSKKIRCKNEYLQKVPKFKLLH